MAIINEKDRDNILLIEYLSKFYSDEEVKELLTLNKNNLFGKNGLAYALGKRSIEYFCLHFLQDVFVQKPLNKVRKLDKIHFEIWNELQQMFVENKWDKEEFILPRGVSKTTTIDMALSVWCHCYKVSRYTIVIGKRKKDAFNFIADTKIALQNKQIQQTFGKLIDSRTHTVNMEELELTNNTKIQAFSSETSVRGSYYSCLEGRFRPSLFILDDVISKDDILTPGAKEKMVDKFYNEILSGGDEALYINDKMVDAPTKFIVLGTPLAPDCFINMIKKDIDFKIFHRSIIDFDPDEYFENNKHWQKFKAIIYNEKSGNNEERKLKAFEYYQKHIKKMKFNTIWNDKYQCQKLALTYFDKRQTFMQELMCECDKIGEKWFKSNRIQSKEEIEANSFKTTMLCVDCASTDTKRSDYFCFIVGSLADNDFKYVRKGELLKIDARSEFDKYINHVLDLLREFPDIHPIYIERNTFSGVDAGRIEQEIKKDPALSRRNIKITNEMQRLNKDQKISTIVDSVNNGRIIFCSERVQPEALQQLMDFSGQKTTLHDDFADCLSEFSNRIDNIKTIQSIKFFDRNLLF